MRVFLGLLAIVAIANVDFSHASDEADDSKYTRDLKLDESEGVAEPRFLSNDGNANAGIGGFALGLGGALLLGKLLENNDGHCRYRRDTGELDKAQTRFLFGNKGNKCPPYRKPHYPQPDPYHPQPNPYHPQPNPYHPQPNPYVEPNKYQPHPSPYYPQPNPYHPHPSPYVEPSPYQPHPSPYYPQPSPYYPGPQYPHGQVPFGGHPHRKVGPSPSGAGARPVYPKEYGSDREPRREQLKHQQRSLKSGNEKNDYVRFGED